MPTVAVPHPQRALLLIFATCLLAGCGHAKTTSTKEPAFSLEVELELDTRPEEVIPRTWQLYDEGKLFSAEALIKAYLKLNPNHLESSVLQAYIQEETDDIGEANATWADVEALLVYQGKIQPFQLQPTLFAGARRYLRLQKPRRARLFYDELWRRFPASPWSQLTQLEVAETAVARGRWGEAARICTDLLRLGANDGCRTRCTYLVKVAARMLTMGPEPPPRGIT